MDDNGLPSRWWARLFFQQRLLQDQEWWLGLAILAIALLGAWLIFWPYLPQLIANLFIGIFDGISWVVSFFTGGQEQAPAAAPATAPITGPVPSPSPSPS